MVEPWLRGTHREIAAVPRLILHALQLAEEDQARWCGGLSEQELHAQPFELPSVAFQMRHIVRSLDRLLTYAEGHSLSEEQLAALRTEHDPLPGAAEEFHAGIATAGSRVISIPIARYEETRFVGRDRLPASLGGLIVHCAEHTQRHAGQMVTTAKVVTAQRKACEDQRERRISTDHPL